MVPFPSVASSSVQETLIMQVCIVSDHEQWNTFLEEHGSGHLLQSYEWGELINTLGNTIIRLGAFDGDRLVGTMMLSVSQVPLPRVLSWLHLKWLYCCRGPNVEEGNREALAALIDEAHALARREHAIVLRLEPNVSEGEDSDRGWSSTLAGFILNPFSVHPRRSWVLDIQAEHDELFQHFSKKWRQNIRQAERRGVTIRLGTSVADFDAFYKLLLNTSIQHDFFLHSKAYYEKIFQTFICTGNGALLIAEHEQRIVGVNMIIKLGACCWDMYSASSNKQLGLNESYLLQHHCFAWAKAQNCTHFDFRAIPEILEPTEEMWGIYEFKKGFGGYSVLAMQTHDYVYRPLLYKIWSSVVKQRRLKRRTDYKQSLEKRKK